MIKFELYCIEVPREFKEEEIGEDLLQLFHQYVKEKGRNQIMVSTYSMPVKHLEFVEVNYQN